MIEYTVVKAAEDLGKVAQEIDQAEVVGLDIETTEYKPHHGEIRLVQVNAGQGVYVIDLFETKTLGPVAKALEGDAIKVIQTSVFEQKWFLSKYGIELWPLFDTHRASALIHNGKQMGHNLYDLYHRELGVSPEAPDLGGSDWSGPLEKEQYDYAAEDVTYLPQLRDSLKPKLEKAGLNRIALIEFGAIIGEAEMQNNGFRLDKESWLSLAMANKVHADKLRRELDAVLPSPTGQVSLPGLNAGFNLNSTQQLQKSLARLGINVTSTAESVLGMIAHKHPAIPKLLEYKKVSKRLSSFGPQFLEHVDPITHRIHCDFWPLTGAGRYSSRSPNLQQIPRTKDYRSCFRPGEGKKLVVCDYGQIELRIAAEITGDKTLRHIYKTGEDAHRRTAAIVAQVPVEEVTKEQRQAAKPVNFGLIYGLGSEKLVIYSQVSYGVTISLKEAKRFIERYFDGYPAIRRWHNRAIRDGERTHMAKTLWGRRRFLDPQRHRNEFFNCLDDKTEALTKRGWVGGFDLTADDVLLTKNAETGRLEWQKPTELKRWPDYEGPLVEFRSRSFNAVSTPNHRWLVYDKRTGRNVCKTTAELSPWGDHRIHRTGVYEPDALVPQQEDRKWIDFVELCGWFLTDGGFFMSGTNKTRPTAMIYQSERGNPEKVKRIDALLDRLQAVTGRYVTESTGQVQWRLTREWSEYLNERLPGKNLNEDFLLSLGRDELHQLFDAMMAGDGHVDAGGQQSFCAGTKEAADVFQVLCTLCGFASSQRARDMSKYEPRSDKMMNVPKMGTVYYVTVLRRDKAQVTADQRREYVARTPIWCPVVPNTYFVARREGRVFVTGNTPIQGSGADGLKRSLPIVYHRLQRYGSRAKMVHMVHDEIVVEVDDDAELIEAVKKDVEEGMIEAIQPMLPHVPVEAEASVGASWADK